VAEPARTDLNIDARGDPEATRTTPLVGGDLGRTDLPAGADAARLARPPTRDTMRFERNSEEPQQPRRRRERARERPQRVESSEADDGYLVGPLPTADQF
jgi:hypothetical protein